VPLRNPPSHVLHRRGLIAGAAALWTAPGLARADAPAARYRLHLSSTTPLKFTVEADLPLTGDRLRMASSYPADLPGMARSGWPSQVRDLRVRDASGADIEVRSTGAGGFRLARPVGGRVRLSFGVDLGEFERSGWPSPLESAVADGDTIMVIGRALFITGDPAPAEVEIAPRPGWQAVMPWPGSERRGWRPRDPRDLDDNLLVFSRERLATVSAGGFDIRIAAMGHWRPLAPLVRRAVERIAARESAFIGHSGREPFTVVLPPASERGGAAFRQSLACMHPDPRQATLAEWAGTLAHEMFHYWNYARLSGADYASTQWFQEGFTEYVADLTLAGTRLISPAGFAARLAEHVANARRLTTTLEAIGSRKGPPLYSAGALTAFCFDTAIREATGGRKDLGAMFRALWLGTGGGTRAYGWPDIRAALEAAAADDWQGFYERHIRGSAPLPLDQALSRVGMRLGEAGGRPVLEISANRNSQAVRLWSEMTGGTGP
jgi:hypothetical protein